MTELRCTVCCPDFVQQYICAYHLNLELQVFQVSIFHLQEEGGGDTALRVKTVFVMFGVALWFWALSGAGWWERTFLY